MEDPCSRGARDALTHGGLHVLPVPVDDGGVRVEDLAATPARTVVLTPADQFPTGVVLAPDRRRELLTWARTVDGLVVEDDYDAEHRYDRAPVPALHASRSEEHTSELQSRQYLVCRLLLEKKKTNSTQTSTITISHLL